VDRFAFELVIQLVEAAQVHARPKSAGLWRHPERLKQGGWFLRPLKPSTERFVYNLFEAGAGGSLHLPEAMSHIFVERESRSHSSIMMCRQCDVKMLQVSRARSW
jgi:hypothetical protein